MKSAVVLVSGGLDSATVIALAARSYRCHALSFSYGQRHVAELDAAKRIALNFNVVEHREFPVPLDAFGGSALTDLTIAVPVASTAETPAPQIPLTYVPARNTVFLSIALAFAETRGIDDIFLGVNVLDYSGYPDCRPEYLRAFEAMANRATKSGVSGQTFRLHAPLLYMSKAEIVRLGTALKVDYSLTVSCYQADREGRACGRCDSCQLRVKGFQAAGLADPTRYQN